tara:strand:+ start:2687 stop:3385 length:699 start_codon:yes stop_codon:yes gene_type:complete
MKISIIVPFYNEETTILKVLDSLKKIDFGFDKEIILVDDGSTDNSKKIIQKYLIKNKTTRKFFKLISKKNEGKGSAVRNGINRSTGDIITIQDADLEYNPEDLKKLTKILINENCEVVYGSRFLKNHKPLYKIYFLGNKFLTFLTQILYGTKITDMETCYKMFRKKTINQINLISNGFNIEPEITAKLLKKNIKITELPISYCPRSLKEGKKINWKDGIIAIYTLIYLKFFD